MDDGKVVGKRLRRLGKLNGAAMRLYTTLTAEGGRPRQQSHAF